LIRYLSHKEIEFEKWDLCLEQASNSLVYGYSWYLNKVSPNWDALVLDDYHAVMPLTHGRKYFICYLHQPFFTQQLGVFAKAQLNQDLIIEFISAIPSKFKFIEVNLNEQNYFLSEEYKLIKRKNYLLNLNKPYDKLVKDYNNQALRNLKKSRKQEIELRTIQYKEVITFYRIHKSEVTLGVKSEDYLALEGLMEVAYKRGKLFSKGVFSKSGELLACGSYLMQKGRIIFLIGTSSASGRETGAMHYLMDSMIFQFSNHKMLFDFEGSEIPGIARFYKSFGAIKTHYFRLKKNRLPWLLRLLK
jgi:hypothetical protein